MQTKDKHIEITKPKVTNSKISCKIIPSKKIKDYFKEQTFYADYYQDINKVDPSILQIPALSTIIPTAWATGADIYLETLDKTYLESLEKIRKIMKTWYPKLSFNTKIHVDNIIKNNYKNNKKIGLLFSGGGDSLCSYFRWKNQKPILMMIWGVDIPVKQETFWKKVQKTYIKFAQDEKATIKFIKTNTRECINEAALTRDYSRYLTAYSWWGGLSYGIITLSLCAPLTKTEKIGTMLRGSSVHPGFKYPWGAHIITDERTSWADIKIIHDAYEIIKQEKVIRYLAKILKEKKFPIRVCHSQFETLNCVKCNKCLRIITYLIIGGIDPKRAGFNIEKNYSKLLRKHVIKLNEKKIFKKDIIWWNDIKENYKPKKQNQNLYNIKDFFNLNISPQ